MPLVLAYHASRDLVPLYSVYALLFADHGVGATQISLLFVVWSATSFVFEVPSGAWADSFDRRRVLVVSAAIYAGGFACWMLWPTFPGFALGFVLWGLSSALMSGTFESLVYDELVVRGSPAAYPGLIGWAQSTALVANLLATASAAWLLHVGGYALVGWTSVAICGLQALLAATLPVSRRARRPAHVSPLAET
ncbi:MAG: MFS transporter, partial [Nocardioides sp.]